MAKTLRVRAVPPARVLHPHAEAKHDLIINYVGWRWDESAQDHVPTGEVVELPWSQIAASHVRDGAWAPADAETAAVCGVPFVAASTAAPKSSFPKSGA